MSERGTTPAPAPPSSRCPGAGTPTRYLDTAQWHIALGEVNRSYDVPMAVSKTLPRPRPGAEVDDVVRLNESLNQLTIEQLAAESGMSARNIRSQRRRTG